MLSEPKSDSEWSPIWRMKLGQLTRDWGLSIVVTLLALLWISFVASSWAQAVELEKSDEYHFDWLDSDKKIYVLQNRKFLKGERLEFSLTGGIGFSNPYRSTWVIDPRLSYFFSESWGIEFFYAFLNQSPNSTFQALTLASSSAIPQIREISAQTGVLIQFVPWYAKINVFNKILHFDWYFGLGTGTVKTNVYSSVKINDSIQTQENLLAFFFSTGHLYHLNQSFDVRLDITGAHYQAPINGLTGDSSWYSSYNFGIGLGFKL